MNIKEIKEIIELMKENNLREFEMERAGLRISLKRGVPGSPEVITTSISQAPIHVAAPPQEKHEPERPDNIVEIKSPMVGTFYSAPAPDAASYVVTGQEVDSNDVVCIIEAMKVMNEIKADLRCRIKEMLVKNGDPVEFDQPLFLVEKL